jgi:hypothetical protein
MTQQHEEGEHRTLLDVGVGSAEKHPPAGTFPRLTLGDDGYYWFLHSLFERLEAETGESVDLYGYAAFAGDHLAALERMLQVARELVSRHPETWDVYVGTQVRPVYQETYKKVERERFMHLLDTWQSAVRVAMELCRPVVCVGA